MHPGGILATNLSRHMPPEQMAEYREQERREADARDRGYFEDCNEAESLPDGFDPQGELTGIASYAVDPNNAERLWELSVNAIG